MHCKFLIVTVLEWQILSSDFLTFFRAIEISRFVDWREEYCFDYLEISKLQFWAVILYKLHFTTDDLGHYLIAAMLFLLLY